MKKVLSISIAVMLIIGSINAAFAAEMGYELSVNGDVATVTVVDDFAGDVIIASYAADDTLVDAKAFTDAFLSTTQKNELEIGDLERTGASTIKLFLWDNMKPAEMFDEEDGEYNTFYVDGSGNVTASIKAEEDIAEGCEFRIMDSKGGTKLADATATLENGWYTVTGTIPDYVESTFYSTGPQYCLHIVKNNINLRRYTLEYEKAPTVAYASELMTNLEKKLDMLNVLLEKCANAGISTDYESMYANIIDQFIENAYEYIDVANYRHFWYNYERCMWIFDRAKDDLNAYLSGEKVPFDVPKYVTSDIEVDGVTFIADTEYKGEIVRRPVNLVGYNYIIEYNNEIDRIAETGANHVQRPIEMDAIVVDPKTWNVETSGSGVTAEISATKKKSGESAYNVKNTETTGSVTITQNVYMAAGTTYYFGFSAYASGVTSAEMTFAGTTIQIPTSTRFRWQDFASSVTPTGSGYKTLTIELTGKATDFYIDDVYVCAGSTTGINSVRNPGFEQPLETDEKWGIDYTAINACCKELADAEEHNITVDILISTHYTPTIYSNKYPELSKTAARYMDTEFRDMVKVYLDAIIPELVKYKSLKTICLMNEPTFTAANYGEEYNVKYRAFLKERYSESIAALNSVHGTSYTSFDEISMPAHNRDDTSAAFQDYREFNNTFLTDYHQFLADTIRAHTDIPLHSKLFWNMGSYDSDERSAWNYGISYDDLSKITDYNGNDNIYYYHNFFHDWYRDEMSKSITYDTQLGYEYAPVVNSEDHILADYDLDMRVENRMVNATDVWQNAFHGRSQSALWAWARGDGTASILYGGLGARPDWLAEIGRTTYDLNRLSYEVKAVNDMPYEVGVFYSDNSRQYSHKHMQRVYEVYEALYFGGYKAAIVPEQRIGSLDPNIKMLVIPLANNVTEEAINEIYDLAKSGVKIVIVLDGLNRNEKNQAHTSTKVAEIKEMAETITYTSFRDWSQQMYREPLRDDLSAIAETVCEDKLRIYDKSTGKLIDETEYILGYYDGKAIVSICNYDWDNWGTIEAEIYVNDKKLESMTELRSGEYVGDSVTIKAFEPILIECEMETDNSVIATVNSNGVGNIAVNSLAQMATTIVTDENGKIVYIGQRDSNDGSGHTFAFSIKNYDESEAYKATAYSVDTELKKRTLTKTN